MVAEQQAYEYIDFLAVADLHAQTATPRRASDH